MSTNENELIRRAQKGDKQAFEDLVRPHYDRLFNSVLRFTNSYDDACDVTQNVLVNVYRRIKSFKGDANFSTWLYRIAFNESVSFHRAKKVRMAYSLETTDESGESKGSNHSDNSSTTDIQRADSQALIEKALGGLDETSRKVIILREIEEFSYEEIAEVLEIPVGTVRSTLHRARHELRERIQSLNLRVNREKV